MNMQAHIKNKLTQQEKDFFMQYGYLIVENVLDTPLVEALTKECNALTKEAKSEYINNADVISRGGSYLELTSLPALLPKIVGLLGWNIWINHSHANVHPKNITSDTLSFEYGWHRDGGMIEQDLQNGDVPWFSIKVGFFLTDTTRKDSGTTLCVPTSHKDRRELPCDTELPDEAIPIKIKAGGALLMNPRIIHSIRSPNKSNISRKTIFIQWAYRWLHPVDAHSVSKLSHTLNDPIQRQLLGLSTNPSALYEKYASGRSGWYYPNDEEVPLKEYARALYCSIEKKSFQLE